MHIQQFWGRLGLTCYWEEWGITVPLYHSSSRVYQVFINRNCQILYFKNSRCQETLASCMSKHISKDTLCLLTYNHWSVCFYIDLSLYTFMTFTNGLTNLLNGSSQVWTSQLQCTTLDLMSTYVWRTPMLHLCILARIITMIWQLKSIVQPLSDHADYQNACSLNSQKSCVDINKTCIKI